MTRACSIGLLVAFSACATIGSDGQGNLNLPTSGMGPFRKLTNNEEHGVPPYLLDDANALYREPAILRLDDDLHSTRVALYAVARAQGHDVIVRTRANDARSFFGGGGDAPGRAPMVVLRADQSWEGTELSGPSVLSVGTEIYMYYAANGFVGLAKSSDGLQFSKVSSPVLSLSDGVSAPSVARMPDGRYRMLYASGKSIFEAASDDGIAWSPLDADPSTPARDPILAPAPPRFDLAPGERPPFDTATVGDPLLLPRMTPAGRLQFRVLYTGTANSEAGVGSSAIGFAARYGGHGALSRNPLAVLSLDKHEAAPAYFEWLVGTPAGDLTTSNRFLLYVHMDQKSSQSPSYPAIAAASAPVTLTLDPALGFPESP